MNGKAIWFFILSQMCTHGWWAFATINALQNAFWFICMLLPTLWMCVMTGIYLVDTWND